MTTIKRNKHKKPIKHLNHPEDIICVCCLSEEFPLVKSVSCKHLALLNGISDFGDKNCMKHICTGCHSFLVKFSKFREQAHQNIQWLSLKQSVKPNNLFKLQPTPVETVTIMSEVNTIQVDIIKEEYEVEIDSKSHIDVKEVYGTDPVLDGVRDLNADNYVKPGTDLVLRRGVSSFNADNIIKQEGSEDENLVDNLADLQPEMHRALTPLQKARIALVPNYKYESKICQKPKAHRVAQEGEPIPPPLESRIAVVPNREGKICRLTMTLEELNKERQIKLQDPAYTKKEFKCESCVVGFIFKERLQEHIEAKHMPKPGGIVCKICNVIQDKETSFKQHYLNHFKRYQCVKCPYSAKDLKSVDNHFQLNHEKTEEQLYQCNKCKFETISHRSFRHHIAKHDKNFECEVCCKKFATPSVLKVHKEGVHKTVEGIKCDVCDKVFLNSFRLFIHKKKHLNGGSKKAFCVPCKKQFYCHSALRIHLATTKQHTDGQNKRFYCDHCNEGFCYKTTLKNHILLKHFPETMQKCPICNKSLIKRSIQRHIDFVHNNKKEPKNHICDYCGKGFSSGNLLRVHVRIHTGERPLSCAECGATFAHPAALYTHKKLKHGEKKPKRSTVTQ